MSYIAIKDQTITAKDSEAQISFASDGLTMYAGATGSKTAVITANASTIKFGAGHDAVVPDNYSLSVSNISAQTVTVTKVQENALTATTLDVSGTTYGHLHMDLTGFGTYVTSRAYGAVAESDELARVGDIFGAQSSEAARVNDALSSEIARASAAEGVLADNLSSEEARASAAEGVLADNLSSEAARAGDAEMSLLKYVNSFMEGDNIATKFVVGEIETTSITGVAMATITNLNAGDLIAGGIGSYSDARLKKDVEDVADAVAMVNALHPVYYNWNDKPSFNKEKKELGFIAQEVEAVVPHVVRTLDDEMGTKVVAYDRLVSLLVAAIKEQDARIRALEAKA